MRPGAVGWGYPDQPDRPPAATEQALAAAAKDPDRVTDLLDELSRGRLWLPLPDDERPVTDGSSVLLPTVTYLGAEFVPAFTSAQQLAAWHGRAWPAGQASVPAQQVPEGPTPHIVVPAAELARLLPAGRASRSIRGPRPACPSTRRGSVTWPPRWCSQTAPGCG